MRQGAAVCVLWPGHNCKQQEAAGAHGAGLGPTPREGRAAQVPPPSLMFPRFSMALQPPACCWQSASTNLSMSSQPILAAPVCLLSRPSLRRQREKRVRPGCRAPMDYLPLRQTCRLVPAPIPCLVSLICSKCGKECVVMFCYHCIELPRPAFPPWQSADFAPSPWTSRRSVKRGEKHYTLPEPEHAALSREACAAGQQ